DRKIMGLNKSDLIFVASRPGMGKTSIALNILLAAAKSTGNPVAFFSLEMSREQLALRLLAGESHVDSRKLQTGRLSKEEWGRFGRAAADISRTKILINDNSMLTVSDMNAQCRREPDLALVVIDYLQLMTSAGFGGSASNQNRTQIVSEISRFLKIMAKELNVPVVCLSQLNRASADRKDKRPMLQDLRESGSIEQDADIVLGLYRDDYFNQEIENPNEAECIIMKNRHGETGTVRLLWQPEYTTYTTLETRYEDPDY
ncbi:MAG: DnaB-like helicase C-terminal domain-containing protein, partial [Oscillospiraceae bacterium]|nr:DnaB-like helicase C-terminal domain-containing protein [Oscillospiraceae bacterium]